MPDRQRLAYQFDDTEASSLAIAGGKGASLSLLMAILNRKSVSLNYRVPRGFVLSVSALDLQMQRDPQIREAVNRIKEAARETDSLGLEHACKK